MFALDHIAVACTDLAEGTAWVSDLLGVPLQAGGQHARYGTHNTLLGLADGLYLEVIAKDPSATPEAGHAWFGLDDFSGRPRLANWICRTDDLAKAVTQAPPEVGPPHQLSRGDLRWQITVPDDGSLPFKGAYPTLIEWAAGTVHPATRLTDQGCRLESLTISHPQMAEVATLMPLHDPRVTLKRGSFALVAEIDTPSGRKVLR